MAKMLRIYQFSLGGVKASYGLGSDSRIFSSQQYNTCARPVSVPLASFVFIDTVFQYAAICATRNTRGSSFSIPIIPDIEGYTSHDDGGQVIIVVHAMATWRTSRWQSV